MRLVRALLLSIGLLIVVSAVAVVSLLVFIDPAKLKPVLLAEVQKKTGYQVVMDGKFSWSFYPRVGVKVEHMALFIPNHAKPFVDLHNITFVSDLLQLLKGQEKLRGDVYIADMRIFNTQWQHAHVGLHWHNDVLTLQPINASFYQGTLTGVAHGQRLTAVPRWDWQVTLNNVAMQPLLHDATYGQSKLTLSGIGQLNLTATTAGKIRDELLSNLNGSLSFSVKSGQVEGIDLNYLVQSANAFVNRKSVPIPAGGASVTAFDALSATVGLKQGIAQTSNLVLEAPAFITKGTGDLNLIYQTINLQLQLAPRAQDKVRWEVPVMLTGSLAQPVARLDTTELTRFLAQQEIQTLKAKVRDQAKERVHGKAGEILQKLLSN